MSILRPRILLSVEGAALLALCVFFFARLGGNWLFFALFLLTPDIAMLGYLINVRVGAACYNLVHTDALPAALLVGGILTGHSALVLAALIWLAHIGMDRTVGYGLKYPTKFQDTHLARV